MSKNIENKIEKVSESNPTLEESFKDLYEKISNKRFIDCFLVVKQEIS